MRTILIVDDEDMNRLLLREFLEANGHATLEGRNGKVGYEVAAAKKPDLILMDIRMPVVDGLEALKLLRANPETSAIPVIALTAFAMKQDRERIAKSGFDGYLSKPFDLDDLLKLVAQLAP